MHRVGEGRGTINHRAAFKGGGGWGRALSDFLPLLDAFKKVISVHIVTTHQPSLFYSVQFLPILGGDFLNDVSTPSGAHERKERLTHYCMRDVVDSRYSTYFLVQTV